MRILRSYTPLPKNGLSATNSCEEPGICSFPKHDLLDVVCIAGGTVFESATYEQGHQL